MSMGSKKSKEKEASVESCTTQVDGDPRKVNNEKNETDEKSHFSDGGDKNTGDNSDSTISFNQEGARLEQGDYLANDDGKSVSTGGMSQDRKAESKNIPRSSSQMETTNNAKDISNHSVGTTNDIKENQSEKNSEENVAGTTERSTDDAANSTITDDATHSPGDVSTHDIPGSHPEKTTENGEGTSERSIHNKVSPDNTVTGDVSYPDQKRTTDAQDIHSDTNIDDSLVSDSNYSFNTKNSSEIIHNIDSIDNAGESKSETECNKNTEVLGNKDNFSKRKTELRVAQIQEADVKSKISWNDKMKTQAVTVILAVYGLLILLLLYLVILTPSSSIPIPTTPEDVLKKISDISLDFDALKVENSNLRKRVSNLEKDIQKKEDKISNLSVAVENLKQMVEYLREKVPSLDGKVKWMEQEQTEQGNYILLFLVIFLLIFLGITFLIMRRKETQPFLSGQVQSSVQFHSKVGGRKHTSVLDQIQSKSLDKTIGIVSFNIKTQKVHKEMLQRALTSTDANTEIVAVVVDKADKILTIHPSCLVFIFVDRNDRNIILEDPDSEIGDLRRLTTQGVMKMGCTVVVVYVNDRESRDLHGRDLYNPCLQSVKRHPVLKELQTEGRVFSVMDNFNQNQNKHIDQLLKKCEL